MRAHNFKSRCYFDTNMDGKHAVLEGRKMSFVCCNIHYTGSNWTALLCGCPVPKEEEE